MTSAKDGSLISESLGVVKGTPTPPKKAGVRRRIRRHDRVPALHSAEPCSPIRPRLGSLSVFATVDGEFGTIGLGKPGFVLKTWWHRPIANHSGVAQLIECEQFRGERMAPSMSLAALLIDAHL
jgi:hypothetical protein